MLEFLKGLKRFSIATMIVSFVVGLLFVIFPAQCITYTALVVGVSMILVGIIAIIAYVVERDSVLPLILGVIVAICGIIICVKYKLLIEIVLVIMGVFILAAGVGNFATSIRALVFHKKSGWLTLTLSIITIAFGGISITKSTELSETIVQFIGASLIIYAVLALASFIQIMNTKKKVRKEFEKVNDIEVDAAENKNPYEPTFNQNALGDIEVEAHEE